MRPLPSTLLTLAAFCFPSLPARAQDVVQPPTSDIDALRARIEELERRCAVAPSQGVDLSGREVAAVANPADANPLGRPWYENIDVWGFASFVYIDTGSVGEHPHGGFILQEASIYAEARAWENTLLHAELRAAVVGLDFLSTGELYADIEKIWSSESGDYATLRAGRFWVPFGEETYWFHAPENPLISYSAAFPWGLDEGVAAYGTTRGVDWTAAVTTGTRARNIEDGSAKAFNLKLGGKPTANLDLDLSLMRQGSTTASALLFGGLPLDPVGSNGTSTAGASPSSEIEANLGELGASLMFSPRVSLGLTLGTAAIDDDVDAFDRDFHWFRCEPRLDLTPSVYAVLRYSEVGTYDSEEGYQFDGVGIAEGETLGYDVERFQRIAGGLGWQANPHTLLKLEVGRDHFWLIDGSPLSADNSDRLYFALGLVVSF